MMKISMVLLFGEVYGPNKLMWWQFVFALLRSAWPSFTMSLGNLTSNRVRPRRWGHRDKETREPRNVVQYKGRGLVAMIRVSVEVSVNSVVMAHSSYNHKQMPDGMCEGHDSIHFVECHATCTPVLYWPIKQDFGPIKILSSIEKN